MYFIFTLKTWFSGPPARRAYASESQVRDRWLCFGVLCQKYKFQITNSKQGSKPFLFVCYFEFWLLEFICYLLFVFCYLGFPLSVIGNCLIFVIAIIQ